MKMVANSRIVSAIGRFLRILLMAAGTVFILLLVLCFRSNPSRAYQWLARD